MKYPKINSLWKREGWYFDEEKKKDKRFQKGRQSFIIGDYACAEFGNIKKWHVEEKVDGTNIRVLFKQLAGERLIPSIMGRTDAAQLPTHLFSYLQTIATWENFERAFPDFVDGDFEVYLFGEGYGKKIQAAGNSYLPSDVGFIMFDCCINGNWLSRENVQSISEKLGVPICPSIGIMTEEEVIEYVKSKPLSKCSEIPQTIEGVICRAHPQLFLGGGKPLMFKLKCKEF